MFESTEVMEQPGRRRRGHRAAVVPNVYPTGWGTLWAELEAHGQRIYLGTFRDINEAAAAVAAAKRWRDRALHATFAFLNQGPGAERQLAAALHHDLERTPIDVGVRPAAMDDLIAPEPLDQISASNSELEQPAHRYRGTSL